jgi:hypothetical protein
MINESEKWYWRLLKCSVRLYVTMRLKITILLLSVLFILAIYLKTKGAYMEDFTKLQLSIAKEALQRIEEIGDTSFKLKKAHHVVDSIISASLPINLGYMEVDEVILNPVGTKNLLEQLSEIQEYRHKLGLSVDPVPLAPGKFKYAMPHGYVDVVLTVEG